MPKLQFPGRKIRAWNEAWGKRQTKVVPGVPQVAAGPVGDGGSAGRGALGCPGTELCSSREKNHLSGLQLLTREEERV